MITEKAKAQWLKYKAMLSDAKTIEGASTEKLSASKVQVAITSGIQLLLVFQSVLLKLMCPEILGFRTSFGMDR